MSKFLITGSTGFLGQSFISFIKNKIRYKTIKTTQIKKICFENEITHLIHMGFRMFAKDALDAKKKQKKNLYDLKVIKKNIDPRIKVVFLSTIGVNFVKKNNYTNFYNYSKLECENYIKKNFSNYLIIRFPNIYGPGQSLDRLIPRLINNLKKRKIIKVKNYNDKRDYIYIEDFNKLLLTLSITKKNQIINISSNNIYTVKQIALKLKKIIKKKTILKLENKNSYLPNSFIKIKNNKKLIKYKNIDMGLKKILIGINYQI